MNCIYKYKGKDYTKEEFYSLVSSSNFIQQEQARKFAELQERLNNKEFLEGAKNAFESSEELQNVYYEAAGIGKFRVTLGRELNPEQKFGSQGEPVVKKFEVLDEHKKVIGTVTLDIAKGGSITAHPTLTTIGKGYGQELYQIISLRFGAPVIEWGPHNISKSPEGKKLWNSLEKKGLAKAKYQWDDDLYLRGIDLSQQKQQALNAYTDYIARVSLGIIKNPSSGEYNYYSKVKDIVYHGVVKGREAYDNILQKGFDFKSKRNWDIIKSSFKEDDNTGMFFSDYGTAQSYGLELTYKINEKGEYEDVGYDNIIPAILNIEYLDSSKETSSGSAAKFFKENKNKKNIGMFGLEGGSEGVHFNHVVFEPEQIHILGSKQDIEGFKKFVEQPINKEIKPNNWNNLQENLFSDVEKSKNFREYKKVQLDRATVNTKPVYDIVNQFKSLERPKPIKALSELTYIIFTRNGIPTYSEVENIINSFKDDNSIYIEKFKTLLTGQNGKDISALNLEYLSNREFSLNQIDLQNKLLLLSIDFINDKLSKLNKPLLNSPITVEENSKKDNFTITENNKFIEIIENEIDKNIYKLSWEVGKKGLTPDNYKGLCNLTAKSCIKALRKIGIDAFPYEISMTAQNPVYLDKLMEHFVALVNLNNKLYIYDQPQSEFLKPSKDNKNTFDYVSEYNPRFIELNTDNLIKNYNVSKEVADKTITRILNTNISKYSVKEYIEDTKTQEQPIIEEIKEIKPEGLPSIDRTNKTCK